MDTEQLDLDFGHEPALVAPATHLRTARRALRRRRVAQGLGGTLAVAALGGVAWATLPSTGAPDQPFATAPTVTSDLPVVAPDDCIGEVCLELVPHGMEPLSPATPAGDMALGFRDGRLVRFSSSVEVVKAIVDPTASGARQSAAVEVVFRGTRFRVAMAEDFGYLIDQVGESPSSSLEQWFAARHALPGSDCAVMAHRESFVESDSPGPGACWVEVDEDGAVRPHAGVTLTRQFTADLPAGTLPPGVRVTGVEFERDDKRWFGVVRQIGDGAFVNTTLARVTDLAAGTTLETWVRETAPDTSMTGIPDGAQPKPWQTLEWWDPATGAFITPDGATVVRRIDNPLQRTAPDDSAGLVFEFLGKRYWALTEVRALPQEASDDDRTADAIRTAGVTVSQAEGADRETDFDSWLAAAVAERQRADEDTP